MKIKSAVDTKRNYKQCGQLEKSEKIGFCEQLLIFVKLLVAFVKRIDLHLPRLQCLVVIFDEMQFCQKLKSPFKQRMSKLLVERKDKKQGCATSLHNKSNKDQTEYDGILRTYYFSVLKYNGEQTVSGNAGLVDEEFLYQSRRRVARVDLLLCHDIDLHRLTAALKRRNGAVEMSYHAGFESAFDRISAADTFGEKINKKRVKNQVGKHAAETDYEPSDFEMKTMVKQRQNAVVRKTEISCTTDSHNNGNNIKNGFSTQLFTVANGHYVLLRAAEFLHIFSAFFNYNILAIPIIAKIE